MWNSRSLPSCPGEVTTAGQRNGLPISLVLSAGLGSLVRVLRSGSSRAWGPRRSRQVPMQMSPGVGLRPPPPPLLCQGPTGRDGARLAVRKKRIARCKAGGASVGPPCPCGEVKEEGAAAGRRRGTFAGKGMAAPHSPHRQPRLPQHALPSDGEEPAPFMINYRVDDLDGLLASLREADGVGPGATRRLSVAGMRLHAAPARGCR